MNTRASSAMPVCIPVSYTGNDGHYRLAYPRSPWDFRLYQVVDCHQPNTDGDTLCTVDDFGNLVVTHRRNPNSLMGMGFVRVNRSAA